MRKQAPTAADEPEESARRQFLTQCGRFAVVTPPAMGMLLSVTMTPSEAYASSIQGQPLNLPKSKSKPKPKPKPEPKRDRD
jgi:hypothetical protein